MTAAIRNKKVCSKRDSYQKKKKKRQKKPNQNKRALEDKGFKPVKPLCEKKVKSCESFNHWLLYKILPLSSIQTDSLWEVMSLRSHYEWKSVKNKKGLQFYLKLTRPNPLFYSLTIKSQILYTMNTLIIHTVCLGFFLSCLLFFFSWAAALESLFLVNSIQKITKEQL